MAFDNVAVNNRGVTRFQGRVSQAMLDLYIIDIVVIDGIH